MDKTMYDYFMEQPQVLTNIYLDRKALTAPFVELYQKEKPDRLYIIASGSSLNASLAACDFMGRMLGIEVGAYPPSNLPDIHAKHPLFLFVSQGGNSTNTIAAIEKLRGNPMMALTGSETCRINELCAYTLIGCGIETAGPKTKGYTGTVLILSLMALEAARAAQAIAQEDYERALADFKKALDHLAADQQAVCEWYARNEKTLLEMEKCVVVGKNVGAQTAKESTLKLQETVLIPVSGYEFEEFLHGPSMAIDEKMGGIYLMPPQDDPDYARMTALVRFHRSICPMVYAISGGPDLAQQEDCPAGADNAWYARNFVWSLPCQIIGARRPERTGTQTKGLDMFWKLDAALNIKYLGRA